MDAFSPTCRRSGDYQGPGCRAGAWCSGSRLSARTARPCWRGSGRRRWATSRRRRLSRTRPGTSTTAPGQRVLSQLSTVPEGAGEDAVRTARTGSARREPGPWSPVGRQAPVGVGQRLLDDPQRVPADRVRDGGQVGQAGLGLDAHVGANRKPSEFAEVSQLWMRSSELGEPQRSMAGQAAAVHDKN